MASSRANFTFTFTDINCLIFIFELTLWHCLVFAASGSIWRFRQFLPSSGRRQKQVSKAFPLQPRLRIARSWKVRLFCFQPTQMLLLQITGIDGVPDYMALTVSANSVGKFRLCTTLRLHSYFGAQDWGRSESWDRFGRLRPRVGKMNILSKKYLIFCAEHLLVRNFCQGRQKT